MHKNFFLSDSIKRFFSLNKVLCVLIFSVLLVGFVTGIFCAVKFDNLTGLDDLPSLLLRLVFTRKISLFLFFILKVVFLALILLLFYFLSFLKIGGVLIFCIIIYLSYLLGIDCTILVIEAGCLKGSLFVLLAYFPTQLILLFLMSVFCFKKASLNKLNNFCSSSFDAFLTTFLSFCVVITAQTILLGVLMKLFVFA